MSSLPTASPLPTPLESDIAQALDFLRLTISEATRRDGAHPASTLHEALAAVDDTAWQLADTWQTEGLDSHPLRRPAAWLEARPERMAYLADELARNWQPIQSPEPAQVAGYLHDHFAAAASAYLVRCLAAAGERLHAELPAPSVEETAAGSGLRAATLLLGDD